MSKKMLTYFEECAIAEFPEITQTREITRKQAQQVISGYDAPFPTKIINPLNSVRRGVFRFSVGFNMPKTESFNQEPPGQDLVGSEPPEQDLVTVSCDESESDLDLRIRKTYENVDILTNSVADGITKSMIVSGSAGIGKSFGIKKILDAHNKSDYLFVKGYVRPTGIFKLLYENRFENQVLIFDDADSIFFDENGLNLLKGALELNKSRKISWLSEKTFNDGDGEEIPRTFDYCGTIIFLTNLDFNTLINKGNKISPHLEALRSRSIYFDMKIRTKKEILCRIKQVVAESGILSDIGLDRDVQCELMTYLTDNMNKTIELSLRTVEKLSALYKASPERWRELADSVILK